MNCYSSSPELFCGLQGCSLLVVPQETQERHLLSISASRQAYAGVTQLLLFFPPGNSYLVVWMWVYASPTFQAKTPRRQNAKYGEAEL